jgi:TonB family protein
MMKQVLILLSLIMGLVVPVEVLADDATKGNQAATDDAMKLKAVAAAAVKLAATPNNGAVREEFRVSVRDVGSNADSAPDLVALGDRVRKANPAAAAAIYYESLRLKDEAAVWAKYKTAKDLSNGDVDFGPYMASLQRRIKKHWFPPKGHEGDRVVVKFKLDGLGVVSGLQLEHPAGYMPSDKCALKAVEDAAPFAPLPNGAPPSVDIQYTFDWNVSQGKGQGSFRKF